MIVEDMERRFFELKGKLDVGVLSEEQFKKEIETLRFQDTQNRWWMIGAQSGKWYWYDGTRWLPGTPPNDVPSPQAKPPETTPQSLTQQDAATPSAAPTIVPPSQPFLAPTQTTQTVPPRAIAPIAPATPSAHEESSPTLPSPARLPRRGRGQIVPRTATPFRLPVAGPVLVAAAGIVAIVALVVFWLLIDNLVAGKPISSFFSNLTGNKSASSAVLTTLTPTPAGGARDVSMFINEGDKFVLQSQMGVALTQYQTAAQIAPNNALLLARWSRALAYQGQMQDALAKAQQAARLAPNDVEVNAQLCRALAWSGQVNEAIVAGEKAFQTDNKNINARACLVDAYLLARRTVDAQGQAYATVQLAPSSADAHRAQAWVLTLLGQRENALVEWKQTVAIEPDFYFRHFEYAEVLRLYFNAPADAMPEYQRAVSLNSTYTPALAKYGGTLILNNKPADAIPQLLRAIRLDSNSAEAFVYLGIAYGQTNQCGQGIPYLEQALRLDPNNSIAQAGLNDCKAGKAPVLQPVPAQPVPLVPPTVTPK